MGCLHQSRQSCRRPEYRDSLRSLFESEKLGTPEPLHTSKDKLAAVSLDDYYTTYRLLAVYLVFLDHYFYTP